MVTVTWMIWPASTGTGDGSVAIVNTAMAEPVGALKQISGEIEDPHFFKNVDTELTGTAWTAVTEPSNTNVEVDVICRLSELTE